MEFTRKKAVQAIAAAAGVFLLFGTRSLAAAHPVLVYFYTLAAVALGMNQVLLELVGICRARGRFAWEEKRVRADAYFLAGTLLAVWAFLLFGR